MNNEQMVEENNKLREQLNEKNKKYYDDLLVYIRINGIFRNEGVIESQLLSILNDIIDAQKDGISAADYFGTQPKEAADGIINQTHFDSIGLAKIIGMCVAILIFFFIDGQILSPKIQFDFGNLLVATIYFTILTFVIIKAVGITVYGALSNRIGRILVFIALAGLISIGFLLLIFLKTPLRFKLDGIIGIIVVALFAIIIFAIYMKFKNNKMVLPFVIYLIGSCGLGIINRLPFIGNWLLSTFSGMVISAVILFGLLLIAAWLSFKNIKSE